ncbi:MAG: amidohydrolase family protein [Terracidiphilus sp.]|jgi:imidazolonepropionase-like amidohydrolase
MDILLRAPRILFARQTGDDLFVINGRIQFRRARNGMPSSGDGLFVLPGLVDAHAHLITSPSIGVPGYTEARQTDPEELTRRVLMHLLAQRDAGVLAVRDAGAPTTTVVDVMKNLDPSLPYLQAAGRFIAPPGRYLPNTAREVSGDDITVAASEEAALGGGWVKFIGDSAHRDHPGTDPDVGWTVDELRPAVESARKAGARIAMHVTTPAAVELAIALDIDSVEHGSHLQPKHLKQMAARGRAWTPTLAAFRIFLERIRSRQLRMPERSFAEAVEAIERQLPQAVAEGVVILCGSDAAIDHGKIGLEVLAFISAGLTPEQALRAATVDAWRYLGLGEPLAENSVADFVAYDRDPLSDPEVLLSPRLVVRNGQIVHDRK